jgi:predicted dienelactone hydrolase
MSRRLPGCAALVWALATAVAPQAAAQDNRVDGRTPAAPELSAPGPSAIGVRTFTAVDRDRVDVLNTAPGQATARADRAFTLEAWYPATLSPGQAPGGEYRTTTRDPGVAIVLKGRAVRDAAPAAGAAGPLVVLSHGYPGNRLLLTHLAEHLATRGYVVVSIDHPESLYTDLKPFASTLYNRALDQRFVIDEVARWSAAGSGHPLSGHVDASRTAVVGYSMGGYGVINLIGGGYRREAASFPGAPPNQLLLDRAAGTPSYEQSRDPRVKAAVAIGPWGMHVGYWDAAGLAGIRTPLLVVAGSVDDVSGYEKGPRAIFEQAVNADRYLLTFLNANHNAAAPIPAPAEAYRFSETTKGYPFSHYADAVWDTVRMNNVLQHFVTAWVDRHLGNDETRRAYFEVVPQGRDAVWATAADGTPRPAHTYWKGFSRGTAVGLALEHRAPAAPR